MKRQTQTISALLLPCILLSSCGKDEVEEFVSSSAKSAISVMHIIEQRHTQGDRPSGPLGVFAGLFTAQGVILPVDSAMQSMDAIVSIVEGQITSASNENFALLREVGDVLQVNIVDMLNRSPNRSESIEEYTKSLKNTGVLLERKLNELETLEGKERTDLKNARKETRDVKRELSTALRNQHYAEASELEERYTNAATKEAEIEAKSDQTGDMIKRFEALIDVTGERLQAIQNNREILIAGLRVISVPGISDLNILEEGKSWRRRKGVEIFSE